MSAFHILFGVALGIILPVSLQLFTISFNIPNILGGLPSKPIMYGYWAIIASIIIWSQLLIELMLQAFQKASVEGGAKERPLKGLLKMGGVMAIYYLVVIAGMITVGISTLTLAFTAGFFAAIAIIPIIGAICFHYLRSNLPTILFTAIVVAGTIVNLLPYSSVG